MWTDIQEYFDTLNRLSVIRDWACFTSRNVFHVWFWGRQWQLTPGSSQVLFPVPSLSTQTPSPGSFDLFTWVVPCFHKAQLWQCCCRVGSVVPAKGNVQWCHFQARIQTPAPTLGPAEWPARPRLCVPLLWQYQRGACELKPLELVCGCPFQDLYTDSRDCFLSQGISSVHSGQG